MLGPASDAWPLLARGMGSSMFGEDVTVGAMYGMAGVVVDVLALDGPAVVDPAVYGSSVDGGDDILTLYF